MVDYLAVDIDGIHSEFIAFDVKQTEVMYLLCAGVVARRLNIR